MRTQSDTQMFQFVLPAQSLLTDTSTKQLNKTGSTKSHLHQTLLESDQNLTTFFWPKFANLEPALTNNTSQLPFNIFSLKPAILIQKPEDQKAGNTEITVLYFARLTSLFFLMALTHH